MDIRQEWNAPSVVQFGWGCSPPPLLEDGNFLRDPFSMAKDSSYHTKQSTPNLFVPPFSMAKKISAPPFRRSKPSLALLPFCSPPPPVISDRSLSMDRFLGTIFNVLDEYFGHFRNSEIHNLNAGMRSETKIAMQAHSKII